jgi:hypothetical protein
MGKERIEELYELSKRQDQVYKRINDRNEMLNTNRDQMTHEEIVKNGIDNMIDNNLMSSLLSKMEKLIHLIEGE